MTVEDLIKRHEGCELKPYTDSVGKLTVGYGRNLTDNGISQAEADLLCQNDLEAAQQGITDAWPHFSQLDPVRQAVITDMAFNLGVAGLMTFHTFLNLMALGRYSDAGEDLAGTLWAKQVGIRATEDIAMLQTGQWPEPMTTVVA